MPNAELSCKISCITGTKWLVMQAILSTATICSRRLRRRGQIGRAQLNSAFAPPQAGRTPTMRGWRIYGTNAHVRMKPTKAVNFARVYSSQSLSIVLLA